jgi:hypothetical protein
MYDPTVRIPRRQRWATPGAASIISGLRPYVIMAMSVGRDRPIRSVVVCGRRWLRVDDAQRAARVCDELATLIKWGAAQRGGL